ETARPQLRPGRGGSVHRPGKRTPMTTVDTAPPAWLTAGRRSVVVTDDDRRTITGMVVPYGAPGRTSAGAPDAGLVMRFRVGPGPAGGLALVDAANHIRDAFSVELDDITLDGDEI